MNRRNLLKGAGSALLNGAMLGAAAVAVLMPANATTPAPAGAPSDARRLAFVNTHTGERFAGVYWQAGAHVPAAMAQIRQVLRDHRSGEAHDIDPGLLDLLHRLHSAVGATAPFQIISGYRSPATNASLQENSSGVATRSLHMQGRAIDIRIDGVDLPRLRDAALALGAGGVGYYEASNFIHVDTGRVRRW